MAQCRFYHAEHTYSATECDPGFCFGILEHPAKRAVPLELQPNPSKCDHEWETIFGKLVVPGTRPVMGGRFVMQDGKIVMTERRFTLCLKCGEINYYHEQLGEIVCHPVHYGA